MHPATCHQLHLTVLTVLTILGPVTASVAGSAATCFTRVLTDRIGATHDRLKVTGNGPKRAQSGIYSHRSGHELRISEIY